MERNPNDLTTGSPTTGGTTGTPSGLGAAGGAPGNTGIGGTAPTTEYTTPIGTAGATGTTGSTADQHSRGDQLKNTAQEKLGQAREQLGHAGTKARDWKQSLEQTLADKLETGASKLRERGTATASAGAPAYATATGAGSSTMSSNGGTSGQTQKLAGGLDATADWLRNGDMKSSIEEQARTNPGRTLLIALGVGYLLGKALRR